MLINKIKQIRKQKKISQQEMADYLHMAQTTYSDIENNISRLSTEDFLLICKYLEIDPISLVKEDNTILIQLTKDEANTISRINKKIESQKKNIQINDNHGNIEIK